MKVPIIITDITKMHGNRICVAGYLPNKTCVRPVTTYGLNYDFLKEKGELIIQPFAIVEFDLQDDVTLNKPHTEDRVMLSLHRAKCGMLTSSQKDLLLSGTDDINVENIFNAAICYGPGFYINDGEGEHSLGTIGSPNIKVIYPDSSRGYRILFNDKCGKDYDLKVTDLSFWKYLDFLIYESGVSPMDAFEMVKDQLMKAKLYLRIGLARGDWEKYPGRCYLQITGVYSFPDYLSGLTLADLE
jgi:hypothetical protein